MIELKYPLILASNSPRRKELLEKLELPFTIQTVAVDESIPSHVTPEEAAKYLAETKSTAHKHLADNAIVLTADTIVLLDNKILGKPSSHEEAYEMLGKLSGKTHKVITGVCIRLGSEIHSFDTTTEVTFEALSPEEINFYVASGNADDKAGAYGIQDWIGLAGIKSIEGSYYNVVGLPVHEVYTHLKTYFKT